ncbi:MAG: hypothetical protein IPH77_03315 [Ignavibacteria bacterium]|nr:hypothetical protein [Ignavibacteria bacterium]
MTAGKIWSRTDAEKILSLGSDFAVIGKAAIGIPDWPNKAKDKNFIPQMPPYTINHLRDADLGDAFIKYMGGWKGFVAEE